MKKLFEETLPKLMNVLKPRLLRGGWLVGRKMTIADYIIGSIYTDRAVNDSCYGREEWALFLKKFPEFENYGKRFAAENATYLGQRPARPI